MLKRTGPTRTIKRTRTKPLGHRLDVQEHGQRFKISRRTRPSISIIAGDVDGQVEYEGVRGNGLGLGRRPSTFDDVDDQNVAEQSEQTDEAIGTDQHQRHSVDVRSRHHTTD